MPNRHKSIGKTNEILQGRYEETMARLQKMKDAGSKVVSIWGVSLENGYSKTKALKRNLASTPM